MRIDLKEIGVNVRNWIHSTQDKDDGKERSMHRWEDKVRMDLKEVGFSVRNWIYSVQDRSDWRALLNVASNLRVS